MFMSIRNTIFLRHTPAPPNQYLTDKAVNKISFTESYSKLL